jgi:hypothetical protein
MLYSVMNVEDVGGARPGRLVTARVATSRYSAKTNPRQLTARDSV